MVWRTLTGRRLPDPPGAGACGDGRGTGAHWPGAGGWPACRQASADHVEAADSTEPRLSAEKAENADSTQPTDPTDRMEPAEPIDRIDPLEPMLRIEPLEPILSSEPLEPRVAMSSWSHPAALSPASVVGAGFYAAAMPNFAVMMEHGARWDSARGIREQELWPEHAAFMDGLVAGGFVIIGGPLGDGALLAVEAPDEQAIGTTMAADPWGPAGILRVGSIQPWSLWLDSRVPGGRATPGDR